MSQDEQWRQRLAFFGLELTREGQIEAKPGYKNSKWSIGSNTTDISHTDYLLEDTMAITIDKDMTQGQFDALVEKAALRLMKKNENGGSEDGLVVHTPPKVSKKAAKRLEAQAKKVKAQAKMIKALHKEMVESRSVSTRLVNGAVIAGGVATGLVIGSVVASALTASSGAA